MEDKSILVVDDEKNIRLTVSKALESVVEKVETAVNGEEALLKFKEKDYFLVFLDMKMPGLNGMEVLKKIKESWPVTRVVIITAYGTINSAVEAMKLGAIDFIQKPFTPSEIRDLVNTIIKREDIIESSTSSYSDLVELTKRYITDTKFEQAQNYAKKALSMDPGKPEAYNLIGVLNELQNNLFEAKKYYRAALDIDPTYKPAISNLERASIFDHSKELKLE